MKMSALLLVGSMLLTVSSFVGSHGDITLVSDLLKAQNFFGLLGVIGGVLVAYGAKSPFLTGSAKPPAPTDTVN